MTTEIPFEYFAVTTRSWSCTVSPTADIVFKGVTSMLSSSASGVDEEGALLELVDVCGSVGTLDEYCVEVPLEVDVSAFEEAKGF